MLDSAALTDAPCGVSELAERVARHVVRELGGEAAIATDVLSGALFGSSRRLRLPRGSHSKTARLQVGFRVQPARRRDPGEG